MTDSPKLRIPCVDDNRRILIGLRRQLDADFDVVTAETGEEGVAILERDSTIAIIIADLRLPGIDGVELLRAARDLNPDSIRMVLTGYGDMLKLGTALDRDLIFRILDKPCPSAVLRQALDEAITTFSERRPIR